MTDDYFFEAVLTALKAISAESDLNKLLESVSNISRTLTNALHASIALAEGEKLRFAYSTALPPERFNKYRIKFGEGIPGTVAQKQVAMTVGGENSDLNLDHSQLSLEFSVTSVLCVPMILHQRTFGTIQVYNKLGGKTFSERDESRLQLFANQAAFAIEHFMLQDKLLKESRRVHAIFEALTDGIMVVDSEGNPLLYNKAIETLFFPEAKQNYALTTYLSALLSKGVHGGSAEVFLLKPHNIILSNRYVVVRDTMGNPSEFIVSIRNITDQTAVDRRFSQFYAIMLRHSNRINRKALLQKDRKKSLRLLRKAHEVLRQLVALTELKSGPLRIEKERCNIIELYSKTREFYLKKFRKARLRLADDAVSALGAQFVRLEPKRIKSVFKTLFEKALKTLPEGGEMRCSASLCGGKIKFETIYSGKDIEKSINPTVLEWNRQVDLVISGESKSLDFDLAFTKHILHAHKGAWEIDANEPHRAIIRFDFPIEN